MPMPANCRQHYETMKKRAAVERVLAADQSN
jgi:hypothetical protein